MKLKDYYMNYRELLNNSFKIYFIGIIMIILSLSCDETEPTSATTPDLSYTLTVQSQVRNCEEVACIENANNEAYGADVTCESNCEDSYHLYLQIKLIDSNDNPVENATIIVEECPLLSSGDTECSGEITSANFISFSGNNTTNDAGVLEGYWKDENETGAFTLTATYEDEYSNNVETNYEIFIRPMGELVDLLSVSIDAQDDILEDGILFIDDENESDSTNYSISINASVIGDGIAIQNAPVNFSLLNQAPGFLDDATGITDEQGSCSATVNILDNIIETKDSLVILVSVLDTEIDSIMASDTSTVYIYTNSYYKLEQTDQLLIEIQNPFDDATNSYQTEFSVKVISKTGARMPEVGLNFNATTTGVGSFDVIEAQTDSIGDPAVVYFNVNPNEIQNIPDDGIIPVNFEISIVDNDILPIDHPLYTPESRTVTYSISGNTDPEFDVSQFNFNPNNSSTPHQTGVETQFSVIALDEFGAPVQDATVYFSLDNGSGNSNGWISDYTVQTCCSDDSNDDDGTETDGGVETDGGIGDGGGDENTGDSSNNTDPGIATITYQNISGGNDWLYASVRDPLNLTYIIAEDSMQINTINACPDCDQSKLVLKASHLTLSESQNSTNIYAFYTDSTGASAEVGTFIDFRALKPEYCTAGLCNGEESTEGECLDCGGEWDETSDDVIDVGALSPESSNFINGLVSDIPSMFPNFDYCLGDSDCARDSSIVYATTTFYMESVVGLVSIQAEYEEFTETDAGPVSIEIFLNNTNATSIDFLDPEVTKIYVQGSGQDISTELEISIKDGNGNIVTDCYTTKFQLGAEAILKGVTFNGDSNSPEYVESVDGFPSVVLHAGTQPATVSVTATLYDGCNLDPSTTVWDDIEIATASTDEIIVSSGPPSYGIIGYSFNEATNIGGGITQMPVSLMLWDTWANEVPNDLSVLFSLNPTDVAYILSSAYTQNINPTTGDSIQGVAWTTIQYNATQLFEFPEVIATTTGNACSDGVSSYEDCEDNGGEWLVNVPLTFSSLTNPVAYENVCVECTLSLVPLSDIQNDFECADADFPVVFRSQLLDFYGVPVEGATVQLLALGTQGGPTFEALVIQDEVFGCFQDNALFGTPGEYDEGLDQLNDATSFEQCTADQQSGCFFDLDDDGTYNNDDWEIDLSEEECPNVTAEICFNDVDGSGDWNDDESLYPEFNASQCNQLGGNHIMFEFGAYEWGTIVESEFSWGVIQGALTFEDQQWEIDAAPYPIKTDADGFKYFRVTFNAGECIQTTFGPPDAYTCVNPAVSALLLNPNGAQSDEITINLNKTCPGN